MTELTRSYMRIILLITCMGSMMAPLDSTIVSVTLPVLSLIPGWASDRIGSRLLASTGMALIAIGLLFMSAVFLVGTAIVGTGEAGKMCARFRTCPG